MKNLTSPRNTTPKNLHPPERTSGSPQLKSCNDAVLPNRKGKRATATVPGGAYPKVLFS
jgi:hypothetical protein